MMRRGFTLVEMLIALILLALLCTGVVSVVRTAAHGATRAIKSATTARLITTVELFLQHDFTTARTSELHLTGSTRLTLPQPVGVGIACDDTPATGTIRIALADWQGARRPDPAHDVVWLLTDSLIEHWDSTRVVAGANALCSDGRPAFAVQTAPRLSRAVFARVVEPTDWSIYAAGGSDWFGLAPADHSAVVQPFAGPLRTGAARFTVVGNALQVLVPPIAGNAVTLVAPLAGP